MQNKHVHKFVTLASVIFNGFLNQEFPNAAPLPPLNVPGRARAHDRCCYVERWLLFNWFLLMTPLAGPKTTPETCSK